jgi:hypothetical protein
MRLFGVIALAIVAMASVASAEPAPGTAKFAGIAFVDASVTGMGSQAKLPAGAKVYPPGTEVTGKDGCPSTPYRTDGLIVAVIDYDGPAAEGSLTLTMHTAAGDRERAPYYLHLDKGRILQALGPVFDDGSYDMKLEWGFGGVQKPSAATASFRLKRSCPATQ